ncbi:hypothetical protein ACPFP2_01495 [Micromonospora citrea]|uniref:hypothetical protein n=1 Tax=Micromonospora citrea TaxID=47855 RepID=UPI003C3B2D0D
MTFASDTVATTRRIQRLRQYMAQNVLAPSGQCICRKLGSCRQSVLPSRRTASGARAAFAAGQLSHVGHHYDLLVDGRPMRILVIAMETGRSREGVTLEERHAEVMHSAGLPFTGRNPHMQGVTSALRTAVGRRPGADREGEHLPVHGLRKAVHLFDAFAMANMRLCSATDPGTTRSRGNATMSRNCSPHMAATIKLLEPTLCIVQGAAVHSALATLMTHRRQLGPRLEQVRIAGVDTLVADFTHPSAWGRHRWAGLTTVPYLYDTVVPTLTEAHRLMSRDRRAIGVATVPGQPDRRRR